MNKTELVKKIAEKANLSQAQSKEALEATIATIKEALAEGETVQLIGFGTFGVTERPERQGINPRTKEAITIAAKKVAKFKPASNIL